MIYQPLEPPRWTALKTPMKQQENRKRIVKFVKSATSVSLKIKSICSRLMWEVDQLILYSNELLPELLTFWVIELNTFS